MFSNKEKLGNFFWGVCVILQPEFIVKAEKIYRVHWKKGNWRGLRADLGLTAGDLVRQHVRFTEDVILAPLAHVQWSGCSCRFVVTATREAACKGEGSSQAS